MLAFLIWLICSAWIFSDLKNRVKTEIAIVSSLLVVGILGLLGNWVGNLFGFEKLSVIFSAVPMVLGGIAGREISKSLRKRIGQ